MQDWPYQIKTYFDDLFMNKKEKQWNRKTASIKTDQSTWWYLLCENGSIEISGGNLLDFFWGGQIGTHLEGEKSRPKLHLVNQQIPSG